MTSYRSYHLVSDDLKALVDQMLLRDRSAPLAQRRAENLRQLREAVQPRAGVERSEIYFAGPDGQIRLLTYRPVIGDVPSPALLHVHGGGFMLGAPEYEDERNSQIAAELGIVVVSVAYRLAPEAHYPAALGDCYSALMWIRDNADALNIDTRRIGVVGESAGGGHTSALCLLARDRGEIAIRFQWLIYPMLDDRTGASVDPGDYCGEFVWTGVDNQSGWRAMLGLEPGGVPPGPYAVPARVENLSELPPTLIQTGALDLFCRENIEYAQRLVAAGVPTELHMYPGAVHGFPMVKNSAAARACRRDAFAALDRELCRPDR